MTDKYKIIEIANYENIVEVLNKFDLEFTPTISSKVQNIEDYALKLQKYGIVLCSIIDNSLVGFIAFYANNIVSKESYISYIGVNREYHNKSIGTYLLNACIEISKQKNMKFLKLEVNRNNKNAINFYIKNKFKFLDDKNLESIYMIRELS